MHSGNDDERYTSVHAGEASDDDDTYLSAKGLKDLVTCFSFSVLEGLTVSIC